MIPSLSRRLPRYAMIATLMTIAPSTTALAFEQGQRIWIDMPALNINDDSYGEGEVVNDPKTGSVSVYVRSLTTSKAFSSGVFCASPSQSEQGWQSPAVYNLISNETREFPSRQLMPWTEGYNRFYERQNWLHTFLKWADHHPVIERSQIIEHQKNALKWQLPDLAKVNELMLLEFDAYQTPQFKPFTVNEKINKLVPVLAWIDNLLTQNPVLDKTWRPLPRDPLALTQTPLTLFMTEAIDKVLLDAQKTRRLVLTKDHNQDTQQLDQLLKKLTRQ